MEKLPPGAERVFYHELGHFVADIINKNHWNGPDVLEFSIEHVKEQNDYTGKVRVNDGTEPEKLEFEKLSPRLTTLIYGCLFQAYFHFKNRVAFKECVYGGHGKSDIQNHKEYASVHLGFMNGCLEKLSKFQDGYVDFIFNEKKFDMFLGIDPIKYATAKGEGYEIDFEMLYSDIKERIEEHAGVYNQFVSNQKQFMKECIEASKASHPER